LDGKHLVQLFFTVMRPISQTNLTKHMAKNKQTSSLIYGSVTYDYIVNASFTYIQTCCG